MLSLQALQEAIPHALHSVELTGFGEKSAGKVRDVYPYGAYRVLITSDRVSAFDRVLGVIPYKGQVLNQLSAWWFSHVADVVRHHLVAVPDPNVTIAHNATPLPVEVVVRGYITGVTSTSLWTLYANGDRQPYGISLPEGLQKNDALPHPIITPTTKAQGGAHDERITREEILASGLVAPHLWEQVERAALALFARGQEVARQAGLILVDTKYEFGLVNGELCLIDEVHTPDSSRFWTQASYETGEPKSFSKEFLREWFTARGYRGEGTPPIMPPEFVADVASRYIQLYEQLTGNAFVPAELPATARLQRALNTWQASFNEQESDTLA